MVMVRPDRQAAHGVAHIVPVPEHEGSFTEAVVDQ